MKNEAIEVLMTRRSVKSYKSEQISDDELKTVLDAGTFAPTARGIQSAFIVAVQSVEMRKIVSELNAKVGGMSIDPYYGAPTILLVLAPDTELGILDGAAVITTMLNAAHAIGLSSCWINRPRQMFETQEGKELLKQWGLDASLCGVASIALGYSDAAPEAAPRKEGYYRTV